MTRLEMLFQILQEEAAEVIQASSKIQRFGLEGSYEDTGKGNIEQLVIEINDFHTLVDMIQEEMFKFDYVMSGIYSPKAISEKRKRVELMMHKSVEAGKLSYER